MGLILIGRKRDEFLDKIFDKVVDFRFDRILGRIRPPWLPQPSHYKKWRPFLLSQVQALVAEISVLSKRTQGFQRLLVPAHRLVICLSPFKEQIPDDVKKEHQKNAIRCCAELASVDGSGLLEEHLRRLQAPLQIQVRNEVRQIDKLARYYFLCRDFIKIARRPNY